MPSPISPAGLTPPALIALLSGANFVIGMGAFVVIGLLEPIANDLGLKAARAGLLMTVYALAYAVLSPLLVAATGRIGRRRVLFFAFLAFAAGIAGCALASSEGTLWAARVLAAAGAGAFTPVSAAVAAGLSAPERRARALAGVFFGLTLAQVAGVPAGAFIGYEYGWRLAFWLVLGLAAPFLWLIWTRVPRGLQFQPVALADLGRVLREGRLMLAVGFTTVFLAGIYVIYTFLATLLASTMAFNGTMISLTLVLFGAGAVIGNILGGAMADRIGPERTLVLLCLSQIVLMPVFSLLPFAIPLVLGLVLAWSVCGWSFMAPQQARLILRAPEVAPVILSLNAAAIYVGAAVGSAIGGVMLNLSGQGALGMTGALVGLLALGVLHAARPGAGAART